MFTSKSALFFSIAAATFATVIVPTAATFPFPGPKDGLQCAAAARDVSCSAKTGSVDPNGFGTCCYNGALKPDFKESGLVLATQFYDTAPSIGPKDSTTIHGLWPDYCDGSYPAFCTADSGIPAKNGAQITELLHEYDPALLDYMNTYYKSDSGSDSDFWDHEYNKHGTCFTSLRAKCQVFTQPGQNGTSSAVVGYFHEIVKQFRRTPTVKWLAEAGITPTNAHTYKLADLQSVLAKRHGGVPYIGCANKTVVNEFWYFNHVQGPLVNGRYVPTDSTSSSSCNADVKFVPK